MRPVLTALMFACLCSQAVEPAFELTNPGTERIVDYGKYGAFEQIGTFDYRYVVRDPKGLAEASGEGIDPNRGDATRNPAYRQARKRIKQRIWDNRFHLTRDAMADYFAWASCGETPGVRLLYTGKALEAAGHYEHALKAYRAAMILYPDHYGWSEQMRWTWLVAPQAWGAILRLIREHPEMNLRLEGAYVQVQPMIDGDPTKNRVAVTPGRLVQADGGERNRARENPEVMKIVERRGGKVQLVKYQNGDWRMLVDGRPYVVKGVTYTPTRVGKHLNEWNWMKADENDNGINDVAFETWVDSNRNGKQDEDEPVVGDFKLLQEMGCNTIRWIHEHPLNPALLRRLHAEYGIRVALCEPLGAYCLHSGAKWEDGTDYTDPEQRRRMLDAVAELVEQVKNEPWLLCYILGNENNMPSSKSSEVNAARTNAFAHPEAYASLLNEAARLIHDLDPDHPVGVGNQGWGLIDSYARHAPELDFIGVNEYVGWDGFGALFAAVRGLVDRPVLITEYGSDAYWTARGPDEIWQERYHRGCWEDIVANTAGGTGEGNSIGGIAFEFLDEWWKDNQQALLDEQGRLVDPGLSSQSNAPIVEMAFPDGWSQEEWFGIVGQGDGESSPFLRQLRKTYDYYRRVWREQSEQVKEDARAELVP